MMTTQAAATAITEQSYDDLSSIAKHKKRIDLMYATTTLLSERSQKQRLPVARPFI